MAPARKSPRKHSTQSSSRTGASRRGRPSTFTDTPPIRLANHWLEGNKVNYVETPNKGGPIQPSYLVFHYTAGRSAQSSIAWLTNPLALIHISEPTRRTP